MPAGVLREDVFKAYIDARMNVSGGGVLISSRQKHLPILHLLRLCVQLTTKPSP